MKKITVMIPTYNEEENIMDAYHRTTAVLQKYTGRYEYEIMFVDNFSQDQSRKMIMELCNKDQRVKAIFNAKNFGYSRSLYYGLTQAEGDCAILLHADMQNPPEVMDEFIRHWENGYKVVIGIKNKSKENPVMYFIRSCYYKLLKHISEIEQIEHFTEYELLDRSFLDVLKQMDDPMPYLRGIVSEFGFQMKRVYFTQEKREKGKSFANFFKSYDFAMLGITSYSKIVMRMATMIGFVCSVASTVIAVAIFISKILRWNDFDPGIAAIGVGVFFLGSIQLFFIGFLGEYVLNINIRVMRRPLVIEECRINFEQKEQKLPVKE